MSKGRFELSGLATAIGSMPHVDPQEACSLVFTHLPEIPAWPQLPKFKPFENMYFQFRPPFLEKMTEELDGWMHAALPQDLSVRLEQLYTDYLENDLERYKLVPEKADGFFAFLKEMEDKQHKVVAVKGQVTGPISWGLTVTDESRRPLIYDEIIADAIAKSLKLEAAWQERELRKVSANTIIFVDEPYLASLGSAFVSFPRERVITLLEEVLEGISGVKGVHCCGNTDWSVVLQTSLDILSFDAYNYGETLSLYPAEVESFLSQGGVIAWGIVPNDEQALAEETVASLRERLEETMGLFSKKGIGYDTLKSQCLITPSCGLGSISVEAAARALELTARVSAIFKEEL